jgi:hypothetical protein
MKLLLAALVLLTASALAQTTDWDAGRAPSPNLDEAQFRWWAPADAKAVRGLLVIIPGRNGDGRGAVNDPDWQALATKQSFAIMGCRLFKPDGAYQGDPDGKTSATIEKAVAELAKANAHPEAAKAPLAFWGHSAGSNTSERFAFRNPRRTIGMVSIKGPTGPGDATPNKCDIPILCCIGKNDKAEWVETACRNYEQGKQQRADWTLALHPTEGHEGGATKPLAVAFLDEVITARLGPPSAALSSGSPLKNLTSSAGWLGDPSTLEAAAYSGFQGKKREATWLPGEATAAAWKAYLTPSPKPEQSIN